MRENILSFFSNLVRNIQLFIIKNDVGYHHPWWLVAIVYQIKIFFLCVVCWEFLSWMGVEFCRMAFWHPFIWYYFSFLSFMMWWIMLIGLQILYQHCIPWINPTWSKYIILFIHWWIGFIKILLKIFVSTFFWEMVFTVFLSYKCFYIILLLRLYWPNRTS